MGAAIGIGITLGVVGAYLYLNWFIASRTAGFIASLFAREDDEEIIAVHEDRGSGHSVWTPVSRGDQRFKYWLFLVLVPILVYVNYRFRDTIWRTMESTAETLVQFAANFIQA